MTNKNLSKATFYIEDVNKGFTEIRWLQTGSYLRACKRSGTDSLRTSWSVQRRRRRTAYVWDAAGPAYPVCKQACGRTHCERRATPVAGQRRVARIADRRPAVWRMVCLGTSKPEVPSWWVRPRRLTRCPAGECWQTELPGWHHHVQPVAPSQYTHCSRRRSAAGSAVRPGSGADRVVADAVT